MITCLNCARPLEWINVIGSSGFWIHPDLADVDAHGDDCNDDDENSAEPNFNPKDTN